MVSQAAALDHFMHCFLSWYLLRSILHCMDWMNWPRDEMLPFCAVVTIHNVKKMSKFLSLLSIWYIFSTQLKCAALTRLELRSPLLGDRSSSRVWVAPGRSPSCALPPPSVPNVKGVFKIISDSCTNEVYKVTSCFTALLGCNWPGHY